MISVEEKCDMNKNGTVAANIPSCPQSSAIKGVSLHLYQLQTIYAMRNLETGNQSISHDDYLTSEIGILSNKVGTGKSLCILGAIADQPMLDMRASVQGVYGDLAHVTRNRERSEQGKNLIVVPNHILKPVWETYIKEYTELSYVIVRKHMYPIEWEEIASYDIVLCNAKNYNSFIKSCPWYWSRVVYDEADTINIPACAAPQARFVWFVTSSLNNLLFSNGYYLKLQDSKIVRYITNGISKHGYIKNTFKTLETVTDINVLKAMVVKMHDEYIEDYLKLPEIKHHTIVCQSPYYTRVVHDHVSQSVRDALHANDVSTAMELLGCSVDTKENLISYVTRNLRIQRKNLIAKLEFLHSMEIFNTAADHARNSKIMLVTKDIDTMDAELERMQLAVSTIDHEDISDPCPICFDAKENKVLMLCCLNSFCQQCIGKMLVHETKTCPLCRSTLRCRNMIQVAKQPVVDSKNDILWNFIHTHQHKKVVVFYKSDTGIESVLIKCKSVKFKVLNGNNYAIMKTLEWFEQPDNNLLFVDLMLYSCGLNLIHATDLVFYQRLSVEMENQLIGRAYRHGRDTENVLHVHHLLHHEETLT